MTFLPRLNAQIERQAAESAVWNTFVQILLPLVMLLTFVAVQVINIYKEAAENEREHVEALERYVLRLEQDNSAAQERRQKQEAYIDLQYQVLLNALHAVEQETRQELKLTLFADGIRRIRMDGARMQDEDFQALCQTAAQLFNRRSPQTFWDGMYQRLLDKAAEPPYMLHDPDPRGRSVKKHDPLPAENVRVAKFEVITPTNRARIHNEILEFTSQIQQDVLILQDHVLQVLCDAYLLHPAELDREAQALIAQLLDPAADDTVRERAANAFYRKMTQTWQAQLENDGYPFLEDLWKRFDAL